VVLIFEYSSCAERFVFLQQDRRRGFSADQFSDSQSPDPSPSSASSSPFDILHTSPPLTPQRRSANQAVPVHGPSTLIHQRSWRVPVSPSAFPLEIARENRPKTSPGHYQFGQLSSREGGSSEAKIQQAAYTLRSFAQVTIVTLLRMCA
jgi:hypothetical protein